MNVHVCTIVWNLDVNMAYSFLTHFVVFFLILIVILFLGSLLSQILLTINSLSLILSIEARKSNVHWTCILLYNKLATCVWKIGFFHQKFRVYLSKDHKKLYVLYFSQKLLQIWRIKIFFLIGPPKTIIANFTELRSSPLELKGWIRAEITF